jgi:putative aminopeptidase FrvX
MNKMADGEVYCGKGPVLNIAPSVHNKLLDFMESVAIKHKIPYQLEVSSDGTGTDTDAFAYGNCGVPSALLSVPLRYMHTSVETICKSDVEQSIELLYEVICALSPKTKYNQL